MSWVRGPRRSHTIIAGLLAAALGLSAALAFESVYTISVRTRPPDPLARRDVSDDRSSPATPLPLRLVDSGGLGIPLAGRGADYSHDRRSFREVILQQPPYIDRAAFEQLERDWRSYVLRMRGYGNNAIAIPLLLELIDFDRVAGFGGTLGDGTVYAPGSAYLARHDAVRQAFAPLLAWTDQQGVQVFLETDMLALTPPLSAFLRSVAPARVHPGIDTTDPAVWRIYGAGLDELFDAVPAIAGLVLRFGEGGSLYTSGDWPYRSEVAIRQPDQLRAMLRGLLPLFEARDKTLVLRSWTVGVGRLGRLHLDPAIYQSALGDIDSPALVVSTKYTAGDFFSYLPLNPTLAGGRHRRLIELQAKPEFEGFSAFPDFLGDEHAHALRALRAVNQQIAGTYVLPQFGGPLRAGPRTLYPVHGFWLWTDANVFVGSRLDSVPPDVCANVCADAIRSLEYQETLFDALAAWRQAFLSYYRWLDTGEQDAWAAWRAGRERFATAGRVHVERFAHDINFPAFDLQSAAQAVAAADASRWQRAMAAAIVIVVLAILIVGSPLRQGSERARPLDRACALAWTAAAAPWRLSPHTVTFGTATVVTALAVTLIGLVVATLTGFTAARTGGRAALLVTCVALCFESSAIGIATHTRRGQLLVACVGPLIPATLVLFTAIAYGGPLWLWYSLWTSSAWRVVVITTVVATLLWTAYIMVATRMADGWRAAACGCLAAAGAGLFLLAVMFSDGASVLRFLDRPLNFAPATETMVFALRNYAGVSLDLGPRPWIASIALLTAGCALWLQLRMRGSGRTAIGPPLTPGPRD